MNTKINFSLIVVLNLILCFLTSSCNDDNSTSPPIDTVPVFKVSSGNIWEMKNDFGDSAYFKALDTLLEARFAHVFWDTNQSSCFYLKIIPIRFTYWNNNMKKYEDYALGITDSGYFFGANKNPMINPNYPLEENFYSVLFFIPNDMNDTYSDTKRISLTSNSKEYYVEQTKNWKQLAPDTFEASYKANRETINPYKFYEVFIFSKKHGFTSFRGYNIINK